MNRLHEASGQELVWWRPNPFSRDYELRSGDDIVAVLHYETRMGMQATGEAEGQQWTFTWNGILRPRIAVRTPGATADAATVELPFLGWRGRPWIVRLPDGRSFRWAPTGLTGLEYRLTGADGAIFLRFKRPLFKSSLGRAGKPEMQLEIAPMSRSLPELAVLVLLGRYLLY